MKKSPLLILAAVLLMAGSALTACCDVVSDDAKNVVKTFFEQGYEAIITNM